MRVIHYAIKQTKFLTKGDAQQFIERVRQESTALGIPANKVLLRNLRAVVGASDEGRAAIKGIELEDHRLQINGKMFVLKLIDWSVFEAFIAQYGWKKHKAMHIDFDRLPREGETDPYKILYACAIQLQFNMAASIGNPDGIID